MKLTAGIGKSHLQNAHKSQKSPERVDAYITTRATYQCSVSGGGHSPAPRKGEPDELVELLKMKSGNGKGESAVSLMRPSAIREAAQTVAQPLSSILTNGLRSRALCTYLQTKCF